MSELDNYVELSIGKAEAALADYDRLRTRDAALDAAWRVHRLTRMERTAGTRFRLPPRVERSARGFR
jgi:hypothetical protein